MPSSSTETQMQKERRIFEELPIPRALAVLILPTIVSQIIHVIYNMADTWFVGLTNDPGAVAALSLTLPLFNMITAVSNLFGLGGSSVISRHLGIFSYERAKKAFSVCFWWSIFVSIVYVSALLAFLRPILFLIGAEDSNIDQAVLYAVVSLIIGGIPMLLSTSISHLVRALGDSAQAGLGLTLGAVLNIGLDPLFMFVLLPKGNELLGAAVATALSNYISLAYFAGYLIRKRNVALFSLSPGLLKNSSAVVKDVVKTGFPSFVMILMPSISVSVFNAMVRDYAGAVAVAGLGITRKVDSLAFSVNQGITQGMLPFISYNYSAGKIDRMEKALGLSAAVSFGFSFITSTISYIFAEQLIWLFIKDPVTITYGAWSLRVLCLSVPIYSITYVIIAAFQSTGRFAVPLALAFRRGFLDSLFVIAIRSVFGAQYVLWASPAAESIALILGLIFFFRLMKKLRRGEA